MDPPVVDPARGDPFDRAGAGAPWGPIVMGPEGLEIRTITWNPINRPNVIVTHGV